MSGRFESIFEREDTGIMQRIEIATVFIVVVGLLWLSVTITEFVLWRSAVILLLMAIFASIFWVVDLVAPKNIYTESIGFGKPMNALIGAILGFGFACLFFFIGNINSFSLIVPFAVAGAIFALLASFVEEMVFRSILTPTSARLFQNDWMGAIIGIVAFGLFHFTVYGASWELMIVAMIFGTVLLIGNTVIESTSFGYVAHFFYNFFVVFPLLLVIM